MALRGSSRAVSFRSNPRSLTPFARALPPVRIPPVWGWFLHRLPERNFMARWPDSRRSNLIAGLLIFVLLPLLCWLAWAYVRP